MIRKLFTLYSSLFTSVKNMHHLLNSSSPYLLQHRDNPVSWYPWGDEAIERARAEQKPIFLSIGYSTCHWCHVMAHESFENSEIAKILNEYFICIKVDREERPDIDRLYMAYVQALTGSGGWPLSVWLTPELKPFFGGTYFPPKDSYGRVGFPSVLLQLAQLWKENRSRLEQEALRAMNALHYLAEKKEVSALQSKEASLQRGYEEFLESFDPVWGGFGRAPKFPRPSVLYFILRCQKGVSPRPCSQNPGTDPFLVTLDKMAAGGLHDHLGGGFHRYSVDAIWQVPHFEKMLYDQAQLAIAYLEAWQVTGENRLLAKLACADEVQGASERRARNVYGIPEDSSTGVTQQFAAEVEFRKKSNKYAEVVRNILDYVSRDLTSLEGGFYCAEDADSSDLSLPLDSHGFHPKLEGAFYVWTAEEIRGMLTAEENQVVTIYYNIQEEGNVPEESDPQGELVGKNVLMVTKELSTIALEFGVDRLIMEERLSQAKSKLFAARCQRPRPHRDDKILTAWNGLMISAYARAGAILGHKKDIDTAVRSARFVYEHLYDSKLGELHRSWREGQSTEQGFAEDYAFLIQGLLDLYEATFDIAWLEWAETLQKKMDELFWDTKQGGYFSASTGDPHLLLRMKEDYDGAEPSANAIAALNLLRLSRMLNNTDAIAKVDQIFHTTAVTLEGMPTAVPQLLVALWYSLQPPQQWVIAGDPTASDTQALLVTARKGFHPERVILLVDGGRGQEWLAARNPIMAEMRPVKGKAAVYRCEHFVCHEPLTKE
ncbi:MAG: hypothetical protein A3F67_08450 [Verrucomicrobia bacterium RIFCSPHIGHO2_12_FULL_41_10]|nr:MAG: hypothetical protein A3F67_08450 [Verrucomicrobia bacterium RIFCSPHIGHO2_12_FULL_41_10]